MDRSRQPADPVHLEKLSRRTRNSSCAPVIPGFNNEADIVAIARQGRLSVLMNSISCLSTASGKGSIDCWTESPFKQCAVK